MIACYVKSDDNKHIIPLYGPRDSFRCRQGGMGKSLRFISYKKATYECNKYSKKLTKPLQLYGLSKI